MMTGSIKKNKKMNLPLESMMILFVSTW